MPAAELQRIARWLARGDAPRLLERRDDSRYLAIQICHVQLAGRVLAERRDPISAISHLDRLAEPVRRWIDGEHPAAAVVGEEVDPGECRLGGPAVHVAA